MKKKIISLIALLLTTSLVGACKTNGGTTQVKSSTAPEQSISSINSINNSNNDNNPQYGDDTSNLPTNPISEAPLPSSNPVISSDIISSSIANSSNNESIAVVDSLDQIIEDFVSDLDVVIPSVDDYDLEYTVFYYYGYESYVISAMCEDKDETIAEEFLKEFTDDTNLTSMNDDEYYTVDYYGYLFTDDTGVLLVTFYNESGYFYLSITRYDGLYGTLDVSDVDTNWYVDYLNFGDYELAESFPSSSEILDYLDIEAELTIPSIEEDEYLVIFQDAITSDVSIFTSPDTVYVIIEGNQMDAYVKILKEARYTADVVENVGEELDLNTYEVVEYRYYTGYGYDADKNIYISIQFDEEENTVIAFNRFEDLFNGKKTANTDWTDDEKALMNETLHQVLPFMAFGEDYELYDDSDEEWDVLILEDTYFEDLSEDYIALLLDAGFVKYDDPDYGILYKYDNGSAYIEIFVYYENGNCLEIYFEPSKLGTLNSLGLNVSYVDIVVGVSFQLEPRYTPNTATYPITWSSSNNDLATVDKNGLVTIKSDATVDSEVKITATTAVGKTASCTFGIHANVVTGIAFLQNEYTVIPGADPYIPAYTLMPYGVTTDAVVTYRLGNGENGLHYNEKGELWADQDAVIGTEDALVIKINDFEDVVSVIVISGEKEEVKNTLTGTFFGIKEKNDTYATYTKSENGATYEAQASAGVKADGGKGLQLRSKNSDSGIIGSCEGRTCKSITFNFDSNTQAGRKIDIYVSNNPFAITDMYGSKMTKIGSIEYDANNLTQTYTFTSDYAYIGFRSNDGAAFLKSVEIIWG